MTALLIIGIFSGSMGNRRGQQLRDATAAVGQQSYLEEQYTLALADVEAQDLERARQRFEYIFTQDSEFKDAAEKWIEISLILNVTRTPTAVPATVTPTPTQDLRPQSELLEIARNYLNAKDWDKTLETLAALRKANPIYEIVTVDGMIFTALRNRGVDKILYQAELEGGLYDFALAEKFAPLDRDATIYREWARLYLLGNAFWVAYPEIAASYYGQVAGSAPNLTDASGMSAYFRYWMSLVHIAEQFVAAEDWCAADEAYTIALQAGNSPSVKASADEVRLECQVLIASDTPTITMTPTLTETPTITSTVGGATATATAIGGETATATPIPSATETSAIPSNTPNGVTPTATNTSAPATETALPSFTDTPTISPDTPTSTPPAVDTSTATETPSPPTNTPIPPTTETPIPSNTPGS